MTTSNFTVCFNETAGFEGGYANNPHDPGGATMDGVTQAVYTKYLITHGRHDAPVRAISLADRQAIYRIDFWNEVHGDELYAGLDLCMVDTAWGSGPVEAIKLLQRALSTPALPVEADGKFGAATLEALERHENLGRDAQIALITKVCDERMKLFESLPTWKYFGHGWTTRLNGIEAKALAMHGVASSKTDSVLLPTGVTTPSVAGSARLEIPEVPKAKEGSIMTLAQNAPAATSTPVPATPNLLDTLESLVTAAMDAAPEVSKDFQAAVAEFQKLKASPIGMSLSNVINQLFSHATALDGSSSGVAVVTPKV